LWTPDYRFEPARSLDGLQPVLRYLALLDWKTAPKSRAPAPAAANSIDAVALWRSQRHG
jgi:hypothetical protein